MHSVPEHRAGRPGTANLTEAQASALAWKLLPALLPPPSRPRGRGAAAAAQPPRRARVVSVQSSQRERRVDWTCTFACARPTPEYCAFNRAACNCAIVLLCCLALPEPLFTKSNGSCGRLASAACQQLVSYITI